MAASACGEYEVNKTTHPLLARFWQSRPVMEPRLERSSIAEIQALGVTLTSCECVAVVQTLMESEQAAEPRLPFGSPSPANVLIGSDGSVVCRGCAVTPTVLEIAILVHQLLPAGTLGVPGALRYTIARACTR
jgi:hypothetical protein